MMETPEQQTTHQGEDLTNGTINTTTTMDGPVWQLMATWAIDRKVPVKNEKNGMHCYSIMYGL